VAHFLPWVSPIVAVLCILSFYGYKVIFKPTMSANVSINTDSNLSGPTQIQLNSLSLTDQSLLQNSLQGSFKRKQKSDLPSIPSDDSTGFSESNYYSATTRDTSEKSRIFSENDFCLLSSIKMGTIYNRWMGTIDANKVAVLTTIPEELIKKEIIHWHEFVKRTLDLPKSDHLINIEGIGVKKITYYLITGHVDSDTLASRLTFDPNSMGTQSPMLVPDVMKHISGILEGMEVIKSYGFLHPGLSTKKVLYTKDGICKLYDFCLAEDAPKIVSLKKAQMGFFTLNRFPPESLFRNEYTNESDVWSTAVVIWEILSDGTSPFPIDEEVKPGIDVDTSKLRWPPRNLQLRNVSLFDCWNQNCSLRPSIHHLRSSFKSIFEKLIENSFYEIPVSSLYTPMGRSVLSSPSRQPDNGE
ncbi:putative fibroblast growth factor receptor 1-A-like isoform X4, partial [Apostichopus japonicus]